MRGMHEIPIAQQLKWMKCAIMKVKGSKQKRSNNQTNHEVRPNIIACYRCESKIEFPYRRAQFLTFFAFCIKFELLDWHLISQIDRLQCGGIHLHHYIIDEMFVKIEFQSAPFDNSLL